MSAAIPYYGELIAFATTLSWSIGIFPFTAAAKRLGPNSLNHLRLLMAVFFLTIICLIALPLNLQTLFSSPLPEHWIWFGLSGLIGLALGDYFAFGAFAILGARVTSVFSTLAPAAALSTGYFVIGERINYIGIFGILITISGVIWITMSRSAKTAMAAGSSGRIERGILFGILSAACQGIGLVLANKGFTYAQAGHDLPFFQATWLRMTSATALIFLFSLVRGQLPALAAPVLRNHEKGNYYALAGTIFGPVVGVSLSMYSVSLLHDKPSVAQTIFSLMPIFALPLAWIFYREKITKKAIAGALIAITGVVVLIWREDLAQMITYCFL